MIGCITGNLPCKLCNTSQRSVNIVASHSVTTPAFLPSSLLLPSFLPSFHPSFLPISYVPSYPALSYLLSLSLFPTPLFLLFFHQGDNWRLVLEEHGPLCPPASRPSYSVPVFTTGEALISDFSVQVCACMCACVCTCVCIRFIKMSHVLVFTLSVCLNE